MSKRTLVLGASDNPARYSFLAVTRLKEKGHAVFPLGARKGTIAGLEILTDASGLENIDTVSIYLNPENQKQFYDLIVKLKPKRVIFNPGAENPEFEKIAQLKGIETIDACTLVMLSIGNY